MAAMHGGHSHAHDHTHGHAHVIPGSGRRYTIAIVLNLAFVAVEAAAGFAANSTALLSDAAHNLSDVLGLAMAGAAAWLAGRGSSPRRTYGYAKASSAVLVAIPLFILAGSLMEKGGIGESLVGLAEIFVGRIKGGLGVVMVVSCALFGAISGSGMATLSCSLRYFSNRSELRFRPCRSWLRLVRLRRTADSRMP